MDTNAQVHALLVDNARARASAAKMDAFTLMARLKDLYEEIWGRVALDVHDWHWQAVTLRNTLVAEKVTAPDLSLDLHTEGITHDTPLLSRDGAPPADANAAPQADNPRPTPRVPPPGSLG